MVHRLKTWDEFMMDIATGKKSFEVRLDDRGFDEGHVLLLEGWDNNEKKYTEKVIEAEVTYNRGTESGDVTCPECNKEWYYEHETDNN
jgi:ASC-1-like (ASCH) protein